MSYVYYGNMYIAIIISNQNELRFNYQILLSFYPYLKARQGKSSQHFSARPNAGLPV